MFLIINFYLQASSEKRKREVLSDSEAEDSSISNGNESRVKAVITSEKLDEG